MAAKPWSQDWSRRGGRGGGGDGRGGVLPFPPGALGAHGPLEGVSEARDCVGGPLTCVGGRRGLGAPSRCGRSFWRESWQMAEA